MNCQLQQPISDRCAGCGESFGKYFCGECKIFDDNDKGQFHCDGCGESKTQNSCMISRIFKIFFLGLCRLGGRENFFHCDTCDMCLPISFKKNHTCIENLSRTNCPVCLEDLHTSKERCQILPCQHLVHQSCFGKLLDQSLFNCPICSRSMIDLDQLWTTMADAVERNPMQGRFKDLFVDVFCRDCFKSARAKYHTIGVRCVDCGSFNTIRKNSSFFNRDDVPQNS